MKTKTFKELLDGKIWRAIEAMINGLEKQNKRKDFKIEMQYFGAVKKEVIIERY